MSAAARLLSVLDVFSEDRPALSLTELAEGTGMPLSTVHRLVGELAGWGALERGADGRYRVGLKLWELGSLSPRSLPLRDLALPFLKDLAEVTHENVQLSVLDGGHVVFVERLSGRGAVRTRTRVGGRLATVATAGGLVLLAHAPEEVQEAVLAERVEPYTPYTVTDPGELRAALREVRRLGHAVCERQVTADAISVAAPVRDRRGRVVAALSVVAAYDESAARMLVAPVATAAMGMSRALGHRSRRR
ncbi:MAG TPA: IclR family transcriptional regulator [Nocardioidaceae bacterium]|nr:IclR family transcriptional regulator [Nocardioidaceae bacterium]